MDNMFVSKDGLCYSWIATSFFPSMPLADKTTVSYRSDGPLLLSSGATAPDFHDGITEHYFLPSQSGYTIVTIFDNGLVRFARTDLESEQVEKVWFIQTDHGLKTYSELL